MLSISELADKIIKVCQNIDSVEIRGIQNIKLLDEAYSLCTEVLYDIKATLENYQNENKAEEKPNEVGETIGKSD